MLKPVRKSAKLADVCYDIRGPVMARARQMEEEGQRILKLNIGNLAPFGFDAPDEVRRDVIVNLPNASGYSDSRGLFAARKAIMQYAQEKKIAGVGMDDIIVGNGVARVQWSKALPGIPAGTVLVQRRNGTRVFVNTVDQTFWPAGMPDAYSLGEADRPVVAHPLS